MGSKHLNEINALQNSYDLVLRDGKLALDFLSERHPRGAAPAEIVDTIVEHGWVNLYLNSRLKTAYGLQLDLAGDNLLYVVFAPKTGLACDQPLTFHGEFQLKLTARASSFQVTRIEHGTLHDAGAEVTAFPHTVQHGHTAIFRANKGANASLTLAPTPVPIFVEKLLNDPQMQTSRHAYVFLGGEFADATQLVLLPPSKAGAEVNLPFILVDTNLKKVFDDPTFTVKKGKTGG